jgi:hypothetical protein
VCVTDNGSNYLIITTAPSETIDQYVALFNTYSDFEDFNVIRLNGSNTTPIITNKNIVICSKQFLQSKIDDDTKVKQIKWLKEMKFDVRFIDESHHGGSTFIAQKILTTYGNNSFTVYVTATYIKPVQVYEIPKEAHITWDIEDIRLCKSINLEFNKNRLIAKHGEIMHDVIKSYTCEQIMNLYSIFPDLQLMTFDFKDDVKNAIIKTYKDRPEGFSTDSIFLLKQVNGTFIEEFQDETKVLDLCYAIFGKTETNGYFKEEWDSILKRIITMCNNANINSRTFTKEEPLSIIAFLPTGNIDKLQNALKNLIEKYKVLPDFEVVCLCGKINGGKDAIDCINDAMAIVKNKKKKGLLILTGTMCSLGISLPTCDIALMLNNSDGGDQYFQMIYRCMTEAKGKKCGFVVDLNLQRLTQTIVDYALKLTSDQRMTVKEAIKYIFKQRLIGFNSDEWMHNFFGLTNVTIDSIVESLYNSYSAAPNNAITTILKEMENKMDALNCISSKDQTLFNTIFHTTSDPKSVAEAIETITKDSEVKKGIEKTHIVDDDAASTTSSTTEKKNVNIIKDVLKFLLPLMCLLTVHNTQTNTFMEMCNFIESTIEEKNVLITQLSTWWGKMFATNKDVINIFKKMYDNYLKDDTLFNTTVMRLKEMFCVTKNNRNELSKLIDTYLVPQEMEKKQNAEVSTPYTLRQQMIDTIPKDFWTQERRVFEPCVGKGGFLLDIIARFEEGLKEAIEDSEERYKFIVEECLYWCDINPVNVWICRLLLDPFGKYDLKYHLGDTLQLDIKEKWGIENFDAVIGNPPYQPVSNGKKGGKSLWPAFVEYGLKMLSDEGYLVYVHPALWRKPRNDLWSKMIKYKFHKISIHDEKYGNTVFKATTRFDWYVLQKTNKNIETTIIEEDKTVYQTLLSVESFIPNFGHAVFSKVRAKIPDVGFLKAERDSACHSSRDYVTTKKDDTYKYDIVNAVSKTNGTRYLYSSKPHPHQFDKKVIFSNGRFIQPFYDDGKFGLSEGGIYILVESDEEGEKIVEYLRTPLVSYLIRATKWSNFETVKDVFHNIAHPKEIDVINDQSLKEYFGITSII